MKWSGYYEYKGNKRVFIFGIKERILHALLIMGMTVAIVAMFFLGSFRWMF